MSLRPSSIFHGDRDIALAKLVDERAGINPAPTDFFVGEGFIPSLS